MKKKTLTLSMHCTCGDSVVAKVNNVRIADAILQLFSSQHQGLGHAPCSPEREVHTNGKGLGTRRHQSA